VNVLTTLIDTQSLKDDLGNPTVAIVDCRFDLRDEEWGSRAYAEAHIPGAVYASLDRDLSGTKNGRNGRHPLPAPETLAATFGRLGIDATIQVVAYDQDNAMYASRLWWLLRWLGHDNVAVLDGGFAKWTAEGRPLGVGVESRSARHFVPSVRDDSTIDVDAVRALIGSSERVLVDARAPERYRGEVETLDRVAGHIPGAVNHFFKWNLNDDGTFLSPAEIRDRVRASVGATAPDRWICYCGSGVTACQNLLAFEHAGLHGSRLYAGSWSEWSADSERPIEKSEV
jgi:thiosulfate/3-mercaptopyruvate sulfurtransferase